MIIVSYTNLLGCVANATIISCELSITSPPALLGPCDNCLIYKLGCVANATIISCELSITSPPGLLGPSDTYKINTYLVALQTLSSYPVNYSSTDNQHICLNTRLKSSKKQLKLNACLPKSNSFKQYEIR